MRGVFKVQLTNAHESNEAMIKEMSEHEKVISVHEFKEVLHKLVKDAVDKIAMKKAGIVGKLKAAKQNLIGQDGEATGRDPQQLSNRCVTSRRCSINSSGHTVCQSDIIC